MNFKEYRDMEAILFKDIIPHYIDAIVEAIVCRSQDGGRIFCCGNGGSFLTCGHFAEDAAKDIFLNTGLRVPFISLGTNPGLQMAIANDIGWEDIFSFELNTHKPNSDDILIGLSVSGGSKNVLRAFDLANEHGAFCIAFTGKNGRGPLSTKAHISINVYSEHFGIVEDIHSSCLHYIAYKLMEKETWRA